MIFDWQFIANYTLSLDDDGQSLWTAAAPFVVQTAPFVAAQRCRWMSMQFLPSKPEVVDVSAIADPE